MVVAIEVMLNILNVDVDTHAVPSAKKQKLAQVVHDSDDDFVEECISKKNKKAHEVVDVNSPVILEDIQGNFDLGSPVVDHELVEEVTRPAGEVPNQDSRVPGGSVPADDVIENKVLQIV